MKPPSVRCALFALMLSAAAWPARAAVPLKDVTQEKLRDWTGAALKASRGDPAKADFWKELDPLLGIDPDAIVYEHDKGVPVKLTWECKPKRDLSAAERDKAQKMLRTFFEYALFEHDKGLLNAAEAKKLDAVTRLDVGPNPGEEKKAAGPVRAKDLNQEKVRGWVTAAVEESRKDAEWAPTWKELDELVVIDPEKVAYQSDKGVPVKLTWDAVPKRKLTPDERKRAQEAMRKLAQHVLFEHKKGVVAEADADMLKKATEVAIGPDPEEKRPSAGPLPAKDLDQEKVRGWVVTAVEESRKDPDWVAVWKELDELVVIDPEKVVYEHNKGVPVKLAWNVTPKRKLTADERKKAQEDMRKLAQHILFEHKKGVVAAADVDMMKKATEVVIGPDPAAPPVVADESKDIEALRKEIAALRADVEQMRKDGADAQARMEARIVQLRKEEADARVKLEAEIDELRKRPAGPGASVDVESIRKEILIYKAEIDRLRELIIKVQSDAGARERPAPPPYSGAAGSGMMVQPSSMIYYDWCSRQWYPGAYTVVYPQPRSRPPTAVPLNPPPPLPPPEQLPPLQRPPQQKLPQENREGRSDEASRSFWIGYRSYWQGDYDKALASFDAAVRLDDQDARFWYYKALAERALGAAARAEKSAERGRELHVLGKPSTDLIGAALERVQGQERRFLNASEVVVSDAR